MVTIVPATPEDFQSIRQIAYKTWPVAYGNILPKAQLDYMLGLFYSTEALAENLAGKGHCFLLAKERGQNLGFASFEHHYNQKNVTHIHKIYILPEAQGKGAGRILVGEIEKRAVGRNADAVTLNVNRSNKAQGFYRKMGFEIAGEIDIKLDHGYLMEDYIMEKKL